MKNIKTTGLKKSKLVTIGSTHKDEFGDLYDHFVYNGHSRSKGMKVDLSFPSYPDNLAFYEHFKETDSVSCNRLSFIYVGGDENGKICHHLGEEYTNVTTVDFTESFSSVYSAFQIVNQLPKCDEVRFFFDEKNIRLSKTDEDFLRFRTEFKHLRSENVKNLKIYKARQIKSSTQLDPEPHKLRLGLIFNLAIDCFPNLESVEIVIDGATGFTHDLIRAFCKAKMIIRHHVINLVDGVVKCKPSVQCGPNANCCPNSSKDGYNGRVSKGPNVITNKAETQVSVNVLKFQKKGLDDVSNCNNESVKRKLKDHSNDLDSESEIREIPVEKKQIPLIPVLDLFSDDDQVEAPSSPSSPPPPKRIKEEAPELPPSPKSCAASEVSTNIFDSNTLHTHRLKPVGSSYEVWEHSDDDDDARKGRENPCSNSLTSVQNKPLDKNQSSVLPSSLLPETLTSPISSDDENEAITYSQPAEISSHVINHLTVNTADLKEILQTAEKQKRNNNQNCFVEGVHYDRRRKH